MVVSHEYGRIFNSDIRNLLNLIKGHNVTFQNVIE